MWLFFLCTKICYLVWCLQQGFFNWRRCKRRYCTPRIKPRSLTAEAVKRMSSVFAAMQFLEMFWQLRGFGIAIWKYFIAQDALRSLNTICIVSRATSPKTPWILLPAEAFALTICIGRTSETVSNIIVTPAAFFRHCKGYKIKYFHLLNSTLVY